MGTAQSSTGNQELIGYPTDKVTWSQWYTVGTYSSTSSARYVHYLDVFGGESGACIFSTPSPFYCTGIQSSQWSLSGTLWNEARRWDSTTYNFFDAYGNWP